MSKDREEQIFWLKWGCFSLMTVLLCGGLISVAFYADRHAARFPQAIDISRHDNYTGLPAQFRWDNTYLIQGENFPTVYRWYSLTFDLGAESQAIERCIYLEGTQHWLTIQRDMGVLLCDTPQGQMVFVNRTTSWR